MSQETEANTEGVDFALVAYREEGVWQVQELEASMAASSRSMPSGADSRQMAVMSSAPRSTR